MQGTIVVPLLSECHRFKRWDQCLKPQFLVQERPLITLARDSFSPLSYQWIFITRSREFEQLNHFLTAEFPGCEIIVEDNMTLSQMLIPVIQNIEGEIIITDADSIFELKSLPEMPSDEFDAQVFCHAHKFKSRLGLKVKDHRIVQLTAYPDVSDHSSCGTFRVLNKERFIHFLETARDEDNASELLKSWYHCKAKLAPLQLPYIYNFISHAHVLQYVGRYGRGFHSLKEFYPYYLSEHRETGTKLIHFIGTSIGLFCFSYAALCFKPIFILFGLIAGHAFAWIGHLLLEKNLPVTFQYPLYSFVSDFIMFFELLTGKRSFSDGGFD
ncbi:MAG: hypothetical protein Fur0010_28860 [Bdellovibrio sp.]